MHLTETKFTMDHLRTNAIDYNVNISIGFIDFFFQEYEKEFFCSTAYGLKILKSFYCQNGAFDWA